MLSFASIACVFVSFRVVPLVVARRPNGLSHPSQPLSRLQRRRRRASRSLQVSPPLILPFLTFYDHSNPSALGTFPQRCWFYDGYYKEGGPIVIFNAGENASLYTAYLQNATIAIAYAVGGATIVMEHRYWGASIPVANYSTANMKYFTVENAAAPPPQTPWILTGQALLYIYPHNFEPSFEGGSYLGALAAYVKKAFPDVFFAAYASSAPAITDFYGFFIPITNGAPQDCSADMKEVVTHWDSVMGFGTKEQQHELLSLFGLQNVTHTPDAGAALAEAPWSWESQEFFDFCDALEVKDGVAAGDQGQGLEYALAQWGAWQLTTNLAICGDTYAGDECWGSFNPNISAYTDVSLTYSYKPLFFCDGDPTEPSIVSEQVNASFWARQCQEYFSPGDGVSAPPLPPVDQINARFGGWDISEDHLLFVNGQFDAWRSGGVSSELPSAPKRQSTPEQPILLVEAGLRCSEMVTSNAQTNPHNRVVFDQVVAQIVEWMKESDAVHA
ncbi:serine carboxypeptidase S28-domain-containing protein [Mycena capillaripes]|nr:serine carboxypeptidase S28-domain-containing protein [Mycena capillaripes]